MLSRLRYFTNIFDKFCRFYRIHLGKTRLRRLSKGNYINFPLLSYYLFISTGWYISMYVSTFTFKNNMYFQTFIWNQLWQNGILEDRNWLRTENDSCDYTASADPSEEEGPQNWPFQSAINFCPQGSHFV